MAQQSSGLTGPFWSAESELHYWYDRASDSIIWQGGRQMPRPQHIPRSALLPPNLQQYEYTDPSSSEQYTVRRPPNEPTGPRAGPSGGNVAGLTTAFDGLAVGRSATTNVASYGPSQPSSSRQPSQPQKEPTLHRSAEGVVTKLTDLTEGKIVQVFNPSTRVQTHYQTGPGNEITDPSLIRDGRGRVAYRKLLPTGSEGDTEQLFATFQVRSSPRKFFTVGKVFMVLWSEPAGQTLVTAGVSARRPGTAEGRYGEMVFSKVRRFVVIREASTYCSALPIATYGTQGVGKANVTKSEHAIIYTGRAPPAPLPSEEPVRGEVGMRPDSIRVDPDDREDKLDPRSRIDFGKVHTIQHNIKVKSYGKVNDRSMQALIQQFNNCWYAPSIGTVPTSPSAATPSRGYTDTRQAAAGATRGSVSSDPRREGGSSGSHALGREREGTSRHSEIARRQELQRQQYWLAIEQLENNGYSRENAIAVLNARLAQKAAKEAEEAEDSDG